MVHECAECGGDIPARRFALGYRLCLACGDKKARAVRHCTVPLNKSNYIVVTNREDLKGLNPKHVGN